MLDSAEPDKISWQALFDDLLGINVVKAIELDENEIRLSARNRNRIEKAVHCIRTLTPALFKKLMRHETQISSSFHLYYPPPPINFQQAKRIFERLLDVLNIKIYLNNFDAIFENNDDLESSKNAYFKEGKLYSRSESTMWLEKKWKKIIDHISHSCYVQIENIRFVFNYQTSLLLSQVSTDESAIKLLEKCLYLTKTRIDTEQIEQTRFVFNVQLLYDSIFPPIARIYRNKDNVYEAIFSKTALTAYFIQLNLQKQLSFSTHISRASLKEFKSESDNNSFGTNLLSNELHFAQPQGKGSFSTVFKGYYLEKSVAIKVLKVTPDDPISNKKKLQDEINIIRNLDHKNIVHLIGYILEKNQIIMEFMNLGNLSHYLACDVDLTWHSLIKLSIDITNGLSFLHQSRIIHRDLKCENILLTVENNEIIAKIGDFGLSVKQKGQKEPLVCEDDSIKGSLQCIAPELLISIAIVIYSEASDRYALGMLFWEIASRKIPFKEFENEQMIIKSIKNNKKPIIPKATPYTYSSIICSLWNENPEQRMKLKWAKNKLNNCLYEIKKDLANKYRR